jgi:predicted amidohydrolase
LLAELGDGAGDLVVMPEMALTGYVWRDWSAIAPLATLCSSEDTHRLWVEASARLGVWFVVGHPAVDEGTGSLRNRCTLVSPGGIVGHYDKTCLFPEDTHWASAGTTPPPVWDTPWGRISPLICADIDYPEPLFLPVD